MSETFFSRFPHRLSAYFSRDQKSIELTFSSVVLIRTMSIPSSWDDDDDIEDEAEADELDDDDDEVDSPLYTM